LYNAALLWPSDITYQLVAPSLHLCLRHCPRPLHLTTLPSNTLHRPRTRTHYFTGLTVVHSSQCQCTDCQCICTSLLLVMHLPTSNTYLPFFFKRLSNHGSTLSIITTWLLRRIPICPCGTSEIIYDHRSYASAAPYWTSNYRTVQHTIQAPT